MIVFWLILIVPRWKMVSKYIPFLERLIIELGQELRLHTKIRDRKGKRVLSEVLSKYVPRELIEHPKKSFPMIQRYWLKGPLHDWVELLLGEVQLQPEGYFCPIPIHHS